MNNKLVNVLRERRAEIAEVFLRSLSSMPKWADQITENSSSLPVFVSESFGPWIDYLILYFEKDDIIYKQLLIGEKIKAFYTPNASAEQRKSYIQEVQALERSSLLSMLGVILSLECLDTLINTLDEIGKIILTEATKKQRILLVGDCLFLDIIPFIIGPLLEEGISLECDYATSKNPVVLRDELRKFSDQKFDLVFFSPFSYDFSPEYSQFKKVRNFNFSTEQIQTKTESTWIDVEATLDLMADLFDCPMHVHNSALIQIEQALWKRHLKSFLTRKVRNKARQGINTRLETYAQKKNSHAYKHLFVIDENSMVQTFGEFESGSYIYKSVLQHPAVFGRVLAEHYIDIVYVNAHMAKKKLLVCDLDNTLWDGVIGEGDVVHFHDRQLIIKEIKAKGVVLAINSKNDPNKVHWTGSTLTSDDFVYANINWEPKVHGIKRIQNDLNLKTKDFVFVDDRKDELEMVRSAYPEVLCLNATDAKVWKRFALWRDSLDENQEIDRTLMYKQREERKAFVRDDVLSEDEKTSLFRALDLKLTITQAQPADLKRVVELINRTNQFNLEGSRTNLKEVGEWHLSDEYFIVTGQTADRFGDMGTTCVAAIHLQKQIDRMVLLPFVLSCRVFGYGIEHGVMNYLKLFARSRGLKEIAGRYVETSHNKPCKDFLPQSGFVKDEEIWIYHLDNDKEIRTEWLQVQHPVV